MLAPRLTICKRRVLYWESFAWTAVSLSSKCQQLGLSHHCWEAVHSCSLVLEREEDTEIEIERGWARCLVVAAVPTLTLSPCWDVEYWQGNHEDNSWSKGGHKVGDDANPIFKAAALDMKGNFAHWYDVFTKNSELYKSHTVYVTWGREGRPTETQHFQWQTRQKRTMWSNVSKRAAIFLRTLSCKHPQQRRRSKSKWPGTRRTPSATGECRVNRMTIACHQIMYSQK